MFIRGGSTWAQTGSPLWEKLHLGWVNKHESKGVCPCGCRCLGGRLEGDGEGIPGSLASLSSMERKRRLDATLKVSFFSNDLLRLMTQAVLVQGPPWWRGVGERCGDGKEPGFWQREAWRKHSSFVSLREVAGRDMKVTFTQGNRSRGAEFWSPQRKRIVRRLRETSQTPVKITEAPLRWGKHLSLALMQEGVCEIWPSMATRLLLLKLAGPWEADS